MKGMAAARLRRAAKSLKRGSVLKAGATKRVFRCQRRNAAKKFHY
jgi:hypothetical protein